MDSASDSGSEGWGFESLLACQKAYLSEMGLFVRLGLDRIVKKQKKRLLLFLACDIMCKNAKPCVTVFLYLAIKRIRNGQGVSFYRKLA